MNKLHKEIRQWLQEEARIKIGSSETASYLKRRASLVLLTGPVSYSADPRFSDLAFQFINKLKSEKDILITKAISWLLRYLIKNHRLAVERYLQVNSEGLPRVAIKEVKTKLETGRK